MDNTKFLTIESDTFADLRSNINGQMQKLLRNMMEKDQSEGKITITIDVTLNSEYIPNYDPKIEGETRRVLHPSFAYKTAKQITIKDDVTGKYNSDMEVVWDEDLKQYVEKFVCDTTQRTIFDADFREVPVPEEDLNEVVEDSHYLEGKRVFALPDISMEEDEEEIPFAGSIEDEESEE